MPKRGRPRGSKNYAYEIVSTAPPRCPRCGVDSSNWKTIRGAAPISRDWSGVHRPSGKRYNRVTWRRYRCQCGQCVMLQTLELAQEKMPDALSKPKPRSTPRRKTSQSAAA